MNTVSDDNGNRRSHLGMIAHAILTFHLDPLPRVPMKATNWLSKKKGR